MQASHITLFSVDISTLKKSEIISLIEEKILEGSKISVFTPNTKMLLAAKNQEEIRKLTGLEVRKVDVIIREIEEPKDEQY